MCGVYPRYCVEIGKPMNKQEKLDKLKAMSPQEKIDKSLEHISFSRMQLFLKDPVAFINRYLAREEQKPTKEMEYGKEVHEKVGEFLSWEKGHFQTEEHTPEMKIAEQIRSADANCLIPEAPLVCDDGAIRLVSYADFLYKNGKSDIELVELKTTNSEVTKKSGIKQLCFYQYIVEKRHERYIMDEEISKVLPKLTLVLARKGADGKVTGEVEKIDVSAYYSREKVEREINTFVENVKAFFEPNDSDIVKRHIELHAKLKRDEEQINSEISFVRNLLHMVLDDRNVFKLQFEEGTAQLIETKRYKYSKDVEAKEKELKEMKKREEQNGTAVATVTETLRVG